jgi:hypothetical protein
VTQTLLANAKVPVNELPALLLPALLDTLIMVGIVMSIVVLVGVPLGALVHNLAPGGLFENATLHTILSWIISIGRSLPFLILMAAIMPFTRFITGTNIGIAAAVVPMTLAGPRSSPGSWRTRCARCRRRWCRWPARRADRGCRSSAPRSSPRPCRRSSAA